MNLNLINTRIDNLHKAKVAKQDEFYTQYGDIEKEVEAYVEFNSDAFRDKIVYCNCDDPFESNFFKYFAINFNRLGLKKLITSSYDGSTIPGRSTFSPKYDDNAKRKTPRSIAVILDHVESNDVVDFDNIEKFLIRNQAVRIALKGDTHYAGGDFRSPECVEFLKLADIVVTNPPFSLFREYIAQLMEYEKKFLVLGNLNAVAYKNIFPLLKENKIWLGITMRGGEHEFRVPDYYQPRREEGWRIDKNGIKYFSIHHARWFTNLNHGYYPPKLHLMTIEDNFKFSKHKAIRGKKAYDRYDNYNAIEVPYTDAIPSDYDGLMGVPISFLDKYNREQFEIIGLDKDLVYELTGKASRFLIRGNYKYARIVIRHRHSTKEV
jgi:hypothetical protein